MEAGGEWPLFFLSWLLFLAPHLSFCPTSDRPISKEPQTESPVLLGNTGGRAVSPEHTGPSLARLPTHLSLHERTQPSMGR